MTPRKVVTKIRILNNFDTKSGPLFSQLGVLAKIGNLNFPDFYNLLKSGKSRFPIFATCKIWEARSSPKNGVLGSKTSVIPTGGFLIFCEVSLLKLS
jgi:hypothetical protein